MNFLVITNFLNYHEYYWDKQYVDLWRLCMWLKSLWLHDAIDNQGKTDLHVAATMAMLISWKRLCRPREFRYPVSMTCISRRDIQLSLLEHHKGGRESLEILLHWSTKCDGYESSFLNFTQALTNMFSEFYL